MRVRQVGVDDHDVCVDFRTVLQDDPIRRLSVAVRRRAGPDMRDWAPKVKFGAMRFGNVDK